MEQKRNFCTRELEKFAELLMVNDKEEFINGFKGIIQSIAFDEAFKKSGYYSPVINHNGGIDYSASGYAEYSVKHFVEKAKVETTKMLSEALYVYKSDFNFIVRRLKLIHSAYQKIDRLWTGSILEIIKNRKSRKITREIIKRNDISLSLQDIFSVATSYFVESNWGSCYEFQKAVQ